MTEFTPEHIAELRDLAAKATPLPWTADWSWRTDDDFPEDYYYGWAETPTITGKSFVDIEPKATNDRLYMEAACNALPSALDEIERLQKQMIFSRESETAARASADVVELSGMLDRIEKFSFEKVSKLMHENDNLRTALDHALTLICRMDYADKRKDGCHCQICGDAYATHELTCDVPKVIHEIEDCLGIGENGRQSMTGREILNALNGTLNEGTNCTP